MTCRWCGAKIVEDDRNPGKWKHEKYAGIGSYHTAEVERTVQKAVIHGEEVEYSSGAIMGFEVMPFPAKEK